MRAIVVCDFLFVVFYARVFYFRSDQDYSFIVLSLVLFRWRSVVLHGTIWAILSFAVSPVRSVCDRFSPHVLYFLI